jgi:hypothetical protein
MEEESENREVIELTQNTQQASRGTVDVNLQL